MDRLAIELARAAREWQQDAAAIAEEVAQDRELRKNRALAAEQRRTRVNDILTASAQLATRAILRAPKPPEPFYRAIAKELGASWTKTSSTHPAAALARIFGQGAIATDAARRAARAVDQVIERAFSELPDAEPAALEARACELLAGGVSNVLGRRAPTAEVRAGTTIHGPGLELLPIGRRARVVLERESADLLRAVYITDIDARVRLRPGPAWQNRTTDELKSALGKASPVWDRDRVTALAVADVLRLVVIGKCEAEEYAAVDPKERSG